MITGSAGTVEGSYTYTAYGAVEGHTGTATAALGYDAQYTNADTGLIYLRARSYDPATGQFLSVDLDVEKTEMAYEYAADDPVNVGDPTGLTPWSPKVKQAIAQCQGWKTGRSKNSKTNPFYHNKVVFRACEDILHLPSEVFGTAPGSRRPSAETGRRIAQGVAGAAATAGGVTGLVACEAGTDAIGTAHCLVATVPIIDAGVAALTDAIVE